MAYIINETFTTGAIPVGWYGGSAGDYAYATAPAPLEGTFSLRPSATAATIDLYSQVGTEVSPSWGHFMLNYPSLPSSFHVLWQLQNDAFSTIFEFVVHNDGSWDVDDSGGGQFFSSAAGIFVAATTYHVFWRFKKSTGANDGEIEIWFNTANDRSSTPSNQHQLLTAGTITSGVSQHFFKGGNAAQYIVDVVQWADTDQWAGGVVVPDLNIRLSEPIIGSSLF
jgi:hypothetical protein